MLVALALGAGACSGDDAADVGPEPSSDSSTSVAAGPADVGPGGFRPDPIRWDACEGFECASVSVPLDYADPGGEQIELEVTRVPARGERLGALFVNPGGPGGRALEMAVSLPFLVPGSVPERFDIVAVEPRGVEGSAGFSCGVDYRDVYAVDPTVDDATDRTAIIDMAQKVADGCQRGAGDELAHVGTRNVARDMDSVRAAMADAQLSFFGVSYGTVIGQVYADLFPERIRAMVLDAVVEIGPDGIEQATNQAAGLEVGLHRFADHCAASRECRTDDPIGAVERVTALAERPGGIPSRSGGRDAGPGEVNLAVAGALYSELLWPRLDDALSDALGGDGDGMVALADLYLTGPDWDVYFAVNCLDFDWPSGDVDAFLAAGKAAGERSPHFGEGTVTDYARCVDWPVAPDPLTPVTAETAPPIVVVSTTGDPVTPYAAGVAVA